jgi:hypothetical protein
MTKNTLPVKGSIFKFSQLCIAQSFVDRAKKILMIVLGDDGLFWVVSPADGERLITAGYEYAT